MSENQYRYQYLLSLQNAFTGICITLARCAFNAMMFSAGRSDFSKAWAVSALSGWAFACRRIGGITGKEEYKPLLPARVKKRLTIIYRRFIIVPFTLLAAFLAPQEIAGEDTMLAALYVSYGIMGGLSLLITYRIIKNEKRRLTE